MANRRRGKPSNNQLPDGLAQYALNIIRDRYTDFGPTLACEKLAELHDVHLSKETVRSLMVKAGLWIPRKLQIDGCDHHWFENRAPACTALVYVDDATSRLMQVRFVKSESTFTYFEATRGYLEKHGKPTYDRLQEIDQGAIVDNKRLGRTLEFIKLVQDKRDNNRSQALPAGDGPSRRRRKPTEKKSQRSLNGDDMIDALKTLQSRSKEIFGTIK